MKTMIKIMNKKREKQYLALGTAFSINLIGR